jgi:hypothetical protein
MIRVLIAEDVAAISVALEDALADGGYSAVAVSSNVAALAWLKDCTPDQPCSIGSCATAQRSQLPAFSEIVAFRRSS